MLDVLVVGRQRQGACASDALSDPRRHHKLSPRLVSSCTMRSVFHVYIAITSPQCQSRWLRLSQFHAHPTTIAHPIARTTWPSNSLSARRRPIRRNPMPKQKKPKRQRSARTSWHWRRSWPILRRSTTARACWGRRSETIETRKMCSCPQAANDTSRGDNGP